MRSRQGSLLETLRRAQRFLDNNQAQLGAINASGARRELDARITQLTAYSVDQDAGFVNSKGATGRQAALRKSLRGFNMRAIAAVAKARLRNVPEFRALLLPDVRLSTPRLLAAAAAMAEAATAHQQVFVDAGLPADFVAQLQAAADALRDATDGRAESRGRRVGATRGLRAEETLGRHALQVLDTLVVDALGTNDALVAEWKSLKRVTAKPGMPAGGTIPKPATPPAATAPVPGSSSTTNPPAATEPAQPATEPVPDAA